MIKEHINRQVIITALILIVISIPMIVFIDLGAHHEISYLAIASDAMHDGRFFTFFREGQHPFTEIPPLYMWLSMLDYALEGARGNLLLAVNAVSVSAACFKRICAEELLSACYPCLFSSSVSILSLRLCRG